MIGPGLVFICFLGAAVFTIFYLIKSRHIERMAKIEHGISEEDPFDKNSLLLNLGVFLSALGVGIFTSYLVDYFTNIPDYITIPGFLLLFGGIGLMIAYRLNKKNKG